MMKKVLGVFAVVAGLIGGLVLGTVLNDGAVKIAQRNDNKVMMSVVDRDSNGLTGLAGLVKDRSV